MTPEMAIDTFKNVVIFALYIVSPFLAVTLVVGIAAMVWIVRTVRGASES